MSSTAHPAIHLGFPNTNDLDVSEYLKIRGINLLRAEPGLVPIYAVHDFVRIGYDDYARNIPAFMRSMTLNKTVRLIDQGYPINIPASRVSLFSTSPAILSHDGQSSGGRGVLQGQNIRRTVMMKGVYLSERKGPCSLSINRRTTFLSRTLA
jgi:hypothetical protein